MALLPLAGAPLLSQQQGPTISVNVKMVTMFATVRDKHGALVRNLTKDDFALQQDGHPQTITYFAPDSDLPLTLGLLVDTSMSQRRVLDQERDASHAFIDHLLREDKDKAFVIHFDREVELLQDLTSSRQKLEASLDQLGRPQFSQASDGGSSGGDPGYGGGGGGGGRGSHGGYGGGGGTLLYDAVFLASDELMKKQQGRKAIVVLTDGVDRGSKETLRDAIETAQRADTSSTRFCSLTKRDTETAEATAAGTWAEWAEAVWEAVDTGTIRRNRVPTERKFCSNCRRKPADVSSKSPRKRPLIRFTRKLTKNCAINMRWATPRIKPTRTWVITKSN